MTVPVYRNKYKFFHAQAYNSNIIDLASTSKMNPNYAYNWSYTSYNLKYTTAPISEGTHYIWDISSLNKDDPIYFGLNAADYGASCRIYNLWLSMSN